MRFPSFILNDEKARGVFFRGRPAKGGANKKPNKKASKPGKKTKPSASVSAKGKKPSAAEVIANKLKMKKKKK